MTDPDNAALPAAPVGALAFLGAVVSYVSYYTSGEWPAGLGGWEMPLLVLLGASLLGYALLETR